MSVDAKKVLSYRQLVEKYKTWCENVSTNLLNLGYPSLLQQFRGFRKQEVVTVLARPGVGKSILTLNFVLNYLECSDEIALVLSHEMAEAGIAERVMQLKLQIEGELIEAGFIGKDELLIRRASEQDTHLRNLYVIADRLEVHDIPEYIAHIERVYGKPVGVVVNDHLGLLKNKYYPKGDYFTVTDNMVKLYGYAKDLNIGVINVSQVSREEAKKQEMTMAGGKGSSEIEQSSDFVIIFDDVTEHKASPHEINLLNEIRAHRQDHIYKLMRIDIGKNRRSGNREPVYVLFDTKTILIQEYNVDILSQRREKYDVTEISAQASIWQEG